MFRKLNAWAIMLKEFGSSKRIGGGIDALFRFYVLDGLREEGVFDFLKQPKTYGQILAEMGYVDSTYTRSVFDVLSGEKQNVLVKEDNLYRANSANPLPKIDEVVQTADNRIHGCALMAKGMARSVPARMRNQPIELVETFEADGRQLLSKFDKSLGQKVYASVRSAAFALLTPQERDSLRGADLLEVGCGSGRETAEIWLRYNGEICITAIDPVPGLLEMAKQHFSDNLDEITPGHVPLSDRNRPVFKEASATDLPFPDNSFDAVCHFFVLHWTPDARKSIREIVRVVKPGGLIFGVQPIKPVANMYFDLAVRSNENCHGFFWAEEFKRWYAENSVQMETMTPMCLFRGHKPGAAS